MGSMGGLSGPGFWGEEGAGCCPVWELAPPGASWPAEPLPRHGPFLTTHPLPLSSGLACRRLWAALPPAVSRDDPLCVCPPTPQGLAPRWSAPRPALPAPLATATPSVPVPLASPRAQLHRAGLWAEGRGAAGGRGRLYLWLLSPPARTAPLASSALPVALAGLPPPPPEAPEARPRSLPGLPASASSVWECAAPLGVGAPTQGGGRAQWPRTSWVFAWVRGLCASVSCGMGLMTGLGVGG